MPFYVVMRRGTDDVHKIEEKKLAKFFLKLFFLTMVTMWGP